jgi:H+-translocating NAD(P) transhydrogenase subunit alpha
MVAIIPSVAQKLIKDGHQVVVEKGAGEEALYTDLQYEEAGVKISSRDEVLSTSELLVTVSGIEKGDLQKASDGTILIGKFNPLVNKEFAELLSNSKLKVFSLDMLPRSSIAQSMDVLSSLGSLAGYKSVITAADRYFGYFPMMTTAAGTIPPARVLILGAGVAGLQAIATARRLGSEVSAFDVRKAVKEEVESLGARFVEVEGSTDDQSAGGYAVQQSEEYLAKQKSLIHEKSIKSDVIISTANIPGKKAPLLIEARTVHEMQPGSIIVDLAAESGGNCELTANNKEIKVNGVTIVGNSRLHTLLPKKASLLYANNMLNFIKFMMKYDINELDHEIFTKTYLGKESLTQKNI